MINVNDVVAGMKDIAEADSVGKGIAANWWRTLVSFVVDVKPTDTPVAEFLADTVEAKWKEETAFETVNAKGKVVTKSQPLPGAYRSAKSVLAKAETLGVELVDVVDGIRGKTDIEKECKEAQGDKSVDEKIAGLVTTISNLLDKGEHTDATRTLLADLVAKA